MFYLNMSPCLFIAVLLTLISTFVCDESASGMDDGSSLPSLAAGGKRQHNIMRFGKRPAGGHNLIHFGKRGPENQHRFLFMGKRGQDEEEGDNVVYPFLDNYKRGHTIMRFGKRGPHDTHSFIRFGKRDSEEEDEQEQKRATGGHSMMYFGKRGQGHNMMYFGKRGAGHSMLYFGKRYDDYEPDMFLVPEEETEKRAAHSMIHFGKREGEDELDEAKRGGGSHSMIHFGKRPYDPQEELNLNQLPIYWTPEMNEKRNLLRFGKKTEGSRARNSHAMIHFGKRSESPANESEALVTRTKREALTEEVEEAENVIPYYYPSLPTMWDEDSNYVEYGEPEKKAGSKNVFLRFG